MANCLGPRKRQGGGPKAKRGGRNAWKGEGQSAPPSEVTKLATRGAWPRAFNAGTYQLLLRHRKDVAGARGDLGRLRRAPQILFLARLPGAIAQKDRFRTPRARLIALAASSRADPPRLRAELIPVFAGQVGCTQGCIMGDWCPMGAAGLVNCATSMMQDGSFFGPSINRSWARAIPSFWTHPRRAAPLPDRIRPVRFVAATSEVPGQRCDLFDRIGTRSPAGGSG